MTRRRWTIMPFGQEEVHAIGDIVPGEALCVSPCDDLSGNLLRLWVGHEVPAASRATVREAHWGWANWSALGAESLDVVLTLPASVLARHRPQLTIPADGWRDGGSTPTTHVSGSVTPSVLSRLPYWRG